MHEVWLRPNRRALLFALIPAGVPLVLAAWMWWLRAPRDSPLWQTLPWILVAVSLVLLVGIIGQLRSPRIAFRDGQVLFHVRAGAPIAVPVDVVEAFFLGQGPAHDLPSGQPLRRLETSNLVARLSQQHPEWAEVEVKAALAQWRDGYVTLRGTWCEPLTGELVRTLNRRLAVLHRDGGGGAADSPASDADN